MGCRRTGDLQHECAAHKSAAITQCNRVSPENISKTLGSIQQGIKSK